MVCGCAKAPSADAFAFSLSSPGRRAAFAATQPAATTLLRKHEQTDSAARSGLDRHGMGRPGAERMLARGKDQFPGCRCHGRRIRSEEHTSELQSQSNL